MLEAFADIFKHTALDVQIVAVATAFRVPVRLLWSVGMVESRWSREHYIGQAGEVGYLQVMPFNYERLGISEDLAKSWPIVGMIAGAMMLRELKNSEGTWPKAVGRYNAISADKQSAYVAKVDAQLKKWGTPPGWWIG